MTAVLAAITIAVYWPVGNHEFVNYDDDRYVTENQYVQKGLSLDGRSQPLRPL